MVTPHGSQDAAILRRLEGKGYLAERRHPETGGLHYAITDQGRQRSRKATEAEGQTYKTPKGQRIRVNRHRARREKDGMVRVEVWVPLDRRNELKEIAQAMCDEHKAGKQEEGDE